METKLEQFPATNPNPVLSVGKDGTVLYSNEAGEPLLHEWGVGVGEKVPSYIGDFVQRVISLNSPEKIEVKAGNRVYLVSFHPLPEEDGVNIYGFDISEQKELEGKYSDTVEKSIPFQALLDANHALQDEIQSLRARIEEPEELQRAIREGDLDALVMPVSEEEMMIFTLNSADQAYPILMETNLLDNISDVVYSTDDQFRLVYWNQAAEKVYGWKKGEVIGKNVIEATGSTFNPQTRARLTVELQERGSVTAEIVHTTKSGEHFIFDSNTMVLRDAGGKVVGYVAVNRDITERKQAEVEIQKLVASVQLEKDRLLTLVNSIPDEVWFADTQKKISLVNPAVLKEFDSSTFDNADVEAIAGSSEVYRPDGTPRPVEEAPPLRALKGEIIRNQEEIVRTTVSGELHYRQVNAGPVKDADGNIIGSVSVVRDITEQQAGGGDASVSCQSGR